MATYKDSIESDGTLTRGVAVYELTGVGDTWIEHSSISGLFQKNLADAHPCTTTPYLGYCSHFIAKSETGAGSVTDGECTFHAYSSSSGRISIRMTQFGGNLQGFKDWLNAQKAAGTPVTIYYPLATATETIVTVPTINTVKGTNYVEVETEVKPSNMDVTYRKKTK